MIRYQLSVSNYSFPQEKTPQKPFQDYKRKSRDVIQGHKTTNEFAKPPGKRPHIELATAETVKELLKFRPSANGERRKKARLVVGSCDQPPDKSRRLKFSATPHRGSAKEFIAWSFGERGRDRRRIDLEIVWRFKTRFSRSEED
ncbi:hypothetical protein AVEN_135026-1 [Araneus ventricosus]|uniref:Uncharacterized protein n=2 Tax=Araneus ventricosus TaxID=182803 RepID=A0A4Y2VBP3_ARAVE|nr:hypothetical protein AVEN_190409-1 [Araneus ventricosus]GBO21816.1 hypothetical protein AVEN_60173-1 [Araneus ventricosus]GBO21818.1 hypothetical protein AVEN_135026-1 [Araneus ventricosus]